MLIKNKIFNHSRREDMQLITDIFLKNRYEIFLVGGAVRDLLLGREVYDFDFATNARPEQVNRLFERTVPTGIRHGTVSVLLNKNSYEITTYRTDGVYSDSRHPDEVCFSQKIEDDLSRRDFTINALAYDLKDQNIIDLFSGLADLEAGIIRTIGKADDRFREDALRMIRACRFSAQLGFFIETETASAIFSNAGLIQNLSNERIRDELIKTVMSVKPSTGFENLRQTGILKIILPELDSGWGVMQNKFHKYDVYYHNLYSLDAVESTDYRMRLAALLHDIGKPNTKKHNSDSEESVFYNHECIGAKIASKILRRLKFSNQDIDYISHLIRYHMFYYTEEWTDGAVRRFIRNVGLENIEALFELRRADRIGNGTKSEECLPISRFKEKIRRILEKDNAFSLKDLQINGKILMAKFSLSPSPLLGNTLKYLLECVLDNQEFNTEEKLLELAAEYLADKKQY